MSLDYDDPSLDRLLTEHARRSRAEFTAPGLDGMLSSALGSDRSGRRWLWPAVAAVLLLAVPLITVLLVRHGQTDQRPQPALPSPSPSPTSVRIGPVPWVNAVSTGKTIWFEAQLTPSQYCKGVPTIHATVTEVGATSMTIVASATFDPDRATMPELQKGICTNPGPDSGPAIGISSSVDLPEALGRRSVVDGATHHAYRALDGSIIPDIPGLPPEMHSVGYSGRLGGSVARDWMVARDWVVEDRRDYLTLTLLPIDSPTGSSWLHQGKPSTIGLVNGHPTRLGDGQHSISWTKGGYLYSLNETSYGGEYHRFSQAQLLGLARSIP